MTKVFCDRCGGEVKIPENQKEDYPSAGWMNIIFNGIRYNKLIPISDVCQKCVNDIVQFLTTRK